MTRLFAALALPVMLFLSSQPCARADSMTLEVITLRHRTVDDVIPVLQPLVAPGGTLTGMNDQLVVKSTPENLEEIRQALSTLDRRQRRLMISVKQDASDRARASGQSISGSHSGGDVKLDVPGPAGEGRSAEVTVGDGSDRLRIGAEARRADTDERNTFRVQTLEGQPAYIETGQIVPVPNNNVTVYRGRTVVQRSVEFHKATSGFYVLPRLNGGEVTLLVSPYMARMSGGRRPAFDIQNVETTATGHLGEWIAIGAIHQEASARTRHDLGGEVNSRESERDVLIRVEEIP